MGLGGLVVMGILGGRDNPGTTEVCPSNHSDYSEAPATGVECFGTVTSYVAPPGPNILPYSGPKGGGGGGNDATIHILAV